MKKINDHQPPIGPTGDDDDVVQPPCLLRKAPGWFQVFEKRINSRFDSLETRFGKLEIVVTKHGETLNGIENTLKKHSELLKGHSEIFKRNNLR